MANQKYRVYITGCNARMLSREIASTLGARFIEQRVFPYSFREFLKANGISIGNNWNYGKTRNDVNRLLSQYFRWGGFPDVINYINKRQWLNELYEKIILGDIIQRNAIRNEQAIRLAVKRLAENIKNPTSYNRLTNLIKAMGVSTNAASVMGYVGMCMEACLLFTLGNFASKFAEKETVKKYYFIDNGLLHIFLTDSETALLENICAVTLYRRMAAGNGGKVYFYNKEVEMDFYIPDEKRGIQASYSLQDPSTEQREIKALTEFHRLYGLERAEIVTYSEERTIETPELTIQVVPLAKWLLG